MKNTTPYHLNWKWTRFDQNGKYIHHKWFHYPFINIIVDIQELQEMCICKKELARTVTLVVDVPYLSHQNSPKTQLA